MTNHVHLLATPTSANGVGQLMKRLGQRYVQYFNRRYGRSGSLWEGRFRSCIVDDCRYALACYRYVELNPVRAFMVRHPAEYRWSSYRANAHGEASALITPHDTYLSLARTSSGRTAAYRRLFAQSLGADLVDDFRTATNGNLAVGSERFKQEMASALGRRVTPGRPGRPVGKGETTA
jgi:putative transposase